MIMVYGGTRRTAPSCHRPRDGGEWLPIANLRRCAGWRSGFSRAPSVVRSGAAAGWWISSALDSPLPISIHRGATVVSFSVAIVFIVVAGGLRAPAGRSPGAGVLRVRTGPAWRLLGGAATVYESAGDAASADVRDRERAAAAVLPVTIAYAPLILHFALIFPRERPM